MCPLTNKPELYERLHTWVKKDRLSVTDLEIDNDVILLLKELRACFLGYLGTLEARGGSHQLAKCMPSLDFSVQSINPHKYSFDTAFRPNLKRYRVTF